MSAQSATDRNIRLLQLFWFLCDFQVWIPVWIVYLTIERGFSLTDVTTAEGMFLVAMVVLEVPTGALADHYGRSRSLAAGALCLAGAVMIFAFADSFAVLVASFLLWAVSGTLTSGADMALLYDTLRAGGREAEYERFSGRGTALRWAGIGFATLLGGPLAAAFGTRFTIFAGAATCLVTAVVALSIGEPPRHAAVLEAPRQSHGRTILEAFRELWHQADVRTLVLLSGITGAGLEASAYLMQPYLVDRNIDVGVWFSLLQAPIFFAGIAGALLAARVSTRAAATRTLIVVPVIGVAAYAALVVSPGLAAYAAFPVVYALGSSIRPLATGYVNRRIRSERRATVLSIQAMVLSLVLAMVAPGVGFATDHWGIWAAFSVGCAITGLGWAAFAPALMVGRGRPAAMLEADSSA